MSQMVQSMLFCVNVLYVLAAELFCWQVCECKSMYSLLQEGLPQGSKLV